jgi:hypothetical protein
VGYDKLLFHGRYAPIINRVTQHIKIHTQLHVSAKTDRLDTVNRPFFHPDVFGS